MSDAALDILWGLVLGNGKAWGEVAIEQQKADALAIFAEERPHLHFITRPRGGSKPLALDTPIPTPSGWTTMGDIKCGDQIFDDGGHITRVVKVGEILLGEPCYRVTLADGSWLVASGNHEWVVQDRQIKASWGREFTVTTEEIKEHLYFSDSRSDFRWRIPNKWTPPRIPRSQDRTVVSIDAVDSVPVRCIGVDSPSHLYLAGKSAIPTHNTTDIAGMAIAWLIADTGPMSRGYVVASNSEQAAHVIDAAAAFRARTPELDGILTVENEKIIVENGSWIRVLSLSDSGAWGLREAKFLIADEFCQWPDTRAAKRVYEAIRSTVQKETGCRLCILSSSGEPTHWSRATYDEALREQRMALEQGRPAMWRVSDMPGPVPWQDPDEIEQLRNELSPSAYDRLVLNIWSQDEDRAIAEEDFDIAAQKRFRVVHKVPTGLRGYGLNLRDPVPGEKYLMTVDIGIYRDATAICIAHKEPLDPAHPKGLQRVVVDHLERWSGSRKRPIQLQDVEDWILAYSQRYNRCKVVCDPDQFIGNIQSLNRRGVRAVAFTFSATSVGQIATALVQAFRNRQIWVPDYKGLRDELIRVRLRETAPGVTRLTHDKLKGHDDQAVVIALACHELLGKLGFGTSFRTFMQRDLEQREAIVKTPDSQYFQAVMRHQEQVRNLRGGVADARKAALDKCVHRIRPGEVRCLMCGQIPG